MFKDIYYDVFKDGELVEEYVSTQRIRREYGPIVIPGEKTGKGYDLKKRDFTEYETKCLIRMSEMYRDKQTRIFTLKTFMEWDRLHNRYGKEVSA